AAQHEWEGRAVRRAFRGRNAGFNTFGGRGVQLAEKVSGERIGGVPGAFIRRLGVVGATHLLSWVVLALWQGESPRGALLGNYRAVPRAVVALPHCPEDGSEPRSTRLDIRGTK